MAEFEHEDNEGDVPFLEGEILDDAPREEEASTRDGVGYAADHPGQGTADELGGLELLEDDEWIKANPQDGPDFAPDLLPPEDKPAEAEAAKAPPLAHWPRRWAKGEEPPEDNPSWLAAPPDPMPTTPGAPPIVVPSSETPAGPPPTGSMPSLFGEDGPGESQVPEDGEEKPSFGMSLLSELAATLFGVGKQGDEGGAKAANEGRPRKKQGKSKGKGEKKDDAFGGIKLMLDLVGLVDPTGIADLASGGISLAQGIGKLVKGEEGAGQHFIDAAISGISAIPGGDVAKAGKLRHLAKFQPMAKDLKRKRTEEKLGGIGEVSKLLGGDSDLSGLLGGLFGGSLGGKDEQGEAPGAPSVAAAGGGTFVTDRQTNLTVGEQGPELVTVQPLGEKGNTTFATHSGGSGGNPSAHMAGGGGLIAGAAEGEVVGGLAGQAAEAVSSLARGDWKDLAMQIVKMPTLIEDWGDALLDSKRGLAEFSGTLAQIYAQADVREIMRALDTGEAIGASVGGLSDAKQDLADSLAPFQNLVTNVSNKAVEGLTRLVNLGVTIAAKAMFIEKINENLEWLFEIGSEDPKADIAKMLDDIEKAGDRTGGHRVPRR